MYDNTKKILRLFSERSKVYGQEDFWDAIEQVYMNGNIHGRTWDRRAFLPDFAYPILSQLDEIEGQPLNATEIILLAMWQISKNIMELDLDTLVSPEKLGSFSLRNLGSFPSWSTFIAFSKSIGNIIGMVLYYCDVEGHFVLAYTPLYEDSIPDMREYIDINSNSIQESLASLPSYKETEEKDYAYEQSFILALAEAILSGLEARKLKGAETPSFTKIEEGKFTKPQKTLVWKV